MAKAESSKRSYCVVFDIKFLQTITDYLFLPILLELIYTHIYSQNNQDERAGTVVLIEIK